MSMWTVITQVDLQRYVADAMLTATVEAALGSAQVNPFPGTMQETADYIRSRISGRVQISATPYAVPPELRRCAALLIVEALIVRLSIAIALSDDQKTMIARAYRDLDIAGTSALAITTADDAVTPSVQSEKGSVSVVRKPRSVASRDDYQGL